MTKLFVVGILGAFVALPLPIIGTVAITHASILSDVASFFTGPHVSADETGAPDTSDLDSQKMPLLEAPANPLATSSTTPSLSLNNPSTDLLAIPPALLAQAPASDQASTTSPQASQSTSALSSQSNSSSDTITNYTVVSGDTVSGIAEKFGISVNTVLWANNLRLNSTLKVGQNLTILPINGINYTITSGDTLQAIAAKYKGDIQEIRAYNNMSSDVLKVGDTIVIPDGEMGTNTDSSSSSASSSAHSSSASNTTSASASARSTLSSLASKASAALGIKIANADTSLATFVGDYMRPIIGGVKTQGIHGHNAVDLAEACGSPVYASAAGTVTLSKDDGEWNGGYGNYIVISHPNGAQTLYAHFSQTLVSEGVQVTQGQEIGLMGETGEATGCHVHFEIRDGGIANPF